ncbi:MAG: bifunctional 5,10-methylenetetrahydrofolate dehydrogenase/5,10-methenyltetrahydrofolate cyclohydrolase [Caldisericia bacterium]|nr:bifunctional 5,10-methylenetetrahydrofolate dehydrogenase/5,10-methenyltetrahydrofolate cyclohydrolase [Caldisericia bacterium]
MSYILMDGRVIAKRIKQEIKDEIEKLDKKPTLVSIISGDNPATLTYVNSKKKVSEEIGINFFVHSFPTNLSEEDLKEEIFKFSRDSNVNAIILEMPLPKNYNLINLASAIKINKDVDCMNPTNLGLLLCGKPLFYPSTPLSIMKLLSEYKVEISGKKACVIGRSTIVGKPISLMLLAENATVTMCHSKTNDLPSVTREADIVVSAIGRAEMIDSSFVKKGATVIDVGINVVSDKIVGDVKFSEVAELASYITPVPGGVGALTTVMILSNTLEAYKMQA